MLTFYVLLLFPKVDSNIFYYTQPIAGLMIVYFNLISFILRKYNVYINWFKLTLKYSYF